MNVSSYYYVVILLVVTVLGIINITYIINKTLHPHTATCEIFADIMAGVVIGVVSYIIKFIYRLIISNKLNIGNTSSIFDSFIYPILEEAIKLSIIYYEYYKFDIDIFDMVFIWLGYSLVLNSILLYNPFDYEHIYRKFLNYYHVWGDSCHYKSSAANIEQIENLFENFKSVKEEPNGKKSRNSLTSHDSSHTLVPYNQTTLNKKFSYKDLPTEFNLQSSKFTKPAPSSPIATPMKKSNSSMSTLNCVKNYKSCLDFVDKLYSVSPQNTYYLNNATAIAAFSEVEEQSEPTALPKSLAKSILPELERVFENIDEADDDSSMHSNETHYGGGGGGNVKFKLPNGGKLEFGGGAGFDYKHGKHANDSDSDGDGDDNTQQASPHKPFTVLSFINWFSWLLPPLLPIGENENTKPYISTQERFPLLKHRLSTYSLSEHQPNTDTSNVDYESCEIISKPIIERFIKFQYFMAYYYDISVTSPISPVRVDPLFEKYGQLLIDTPAFWVFLDEFNWLLYNWVAFLMYFTTISASIPIVLVVKMFKTNYLHGFKNQIDYRLIITIESFINFVMLLIEIVLFYRIFESR
ncbi:hypothetical protein Cantr_05481 [Candida viswanathii]|uniref:Uncharacterized protein n=1 Tax=Candida viswanathii TaxID=5486 RepID=A0A367XUS2_9ASCO|nr:hypothetical protein Cantr_05481 [Candida viswanathii]